MRYCLLLLLSLVAQTNLFAQENSSVTKRLEAKYGSASYCESDGGWYRVGDSFWSGKYPNKPGVCDKNGQEIIPPGIYDKIYSETHGNNKFFKVYVGELCGLYSMSGKEILPVKFSDIFDGEYDNIPYWDVRNGEMRGVYDLTGKEIIPIQYTYIRYDDSSNCFETQNGVYRGVRDRNGKEIIPATKYTYIWWNGSSNVYEVRVGGDGYKSEGVLHGLLDATGKEIVEPIYEETVYVSDSKYADVKLNNKYGIIDLNGHAIIPIEYDKKIHAGSLTKSGFAEVERSGKAGLVNDKGQVVIPCKYDDISFPSEELIAVCSNGRWGFVDMTDKVVVPLQFSSVSKFKDGVAKVVKDGTTSLLPNPLVASIAQDAPKVKGKAVSTYPAPNSDVDSNIPKGTKASDDTFAFIIANENYPTAKVPYALNDGWMFEEYCKTCLGIGENHIRLFEDATGGNIISCVEQIKEIANAYDGDASIILYYAGHGVPDEKNNTAYILPIDGNSSDIATTGYSLAKLYKELSELKLKSIIIFLDACFSGAKREDDMLIAGRGVAIKVRDEEPQGNMVVFSASTGDETAHQLEDKGHGLFTYYLLKKMQETGGNVSLGDLSDYVTKQVKRQSVVINNKKQTPTIIPSQTLVTTWRNKVLK